MKIIAFMNQKGGVGKTTTTFNCSAALKILGKKVLVVDLDHQANLTSSFGIDAEESDITVYEVLLGKISLKKAIQSVSGIDIVPAGVALANAELELAAQPGREFILDRAFKKANLTYDYILIDCPPHLGTMSMNAMTAADGIIVVVSTAYYSMQGTARLLKVLELVQERLNPNLKLFGFAANSFDGRNNLDKEVLSYFQNEQQELLFKTVVRQNVSLRESPSKAQDIFTYNPKSHGAEDYLNLTEEIIERVQ